MRMTLAKSTLDSFLFMPPPRQVDPALHDAALNLFLPKGVRIFLYVLPLLFIAAACAAVSLLVMNGRYVEEWRMLHEPTAHAEGVVRGVEVRRGSKGSKTYVYDFDFSLSRTDQKKPVRGYCFSDKPLAAQGKTVPVEYLVSNPSVARIKGARLNPAPLFVVAMIPLLTFITLIMIYGLIVYRKKWIERVFRDGEAVSARIQEIKRGPKNTKIIVLAFNHMGENRTAKVQLPLCKKPLELINARHAAREPVSALVHPVKKKDIFIFDLIMP